MKTSWNWRWKGIEVDCIAGLTIPEPLVKRVSTWSRHVIPVFARISLGYHSVCESDNVTNQSPEELLLHGPLCSPIGSNLRGPGRGCLWLDTGVERILQRAISAGIHRESHISLLRCDRYYTCSGGAVCEGCCFFISYSIPPCYSSPFISNPPLHSPCSHLPTRSHRNLLLMNSCRPFIVT